MSYQQEISFQNDFEDEQDTGNGHHSLIRQKWMFRLSMLSLVLSCFLIGSVFTLNTPFLTNRSSSSPISGPSITSIAALKSVPKDIVYSSLTETECRHLFSLFIAEYGNNYEQDEYETRFQLFSKNLGDIDARNSKETSVVSDSKRAVHGITKFSAMTTSELERIKIRLSKSDIGTFQIPEVDVDYDGSLTSVDWTGILTSGDIYDQGFCGACWSFSVSSQVESDGIRAGVLTVNDRLSAQQVLSCEKKDMECSGGFTENGFHYAKEYGLVNALYFPYSSYGGYAEKCSIDESKSIVKVKDFVQLSSEESMINYVLSTGPLSTCVDSTSWFTYVGGIVTSCGSSTIDHCIQVVGVNVDEGYWIVRNTWGRNWGEDGYIRLALNTDACGITTDPIVTTVVAA